MSEFETMSTGPRPFAFVVMPFAAHFNDTYQLAIKPACTEAGFYCERLDEQIFRETMLERIYNQISKADLIIADMSDRNPNVFYEVGYAHALEKQVILLTNKAADIPSDLRHHIHLVYDNLINLKSELYRRASFFIDNPTASNADILANVEVLINGKPLPGSRECFPIEVPITRVNKRQGTELHASLDLTLSLRGASNVQEADIDLRLITEPEFVCSGWIHSDSSRQVYATVTLPDLRKLHKALRTVSLVPGDPEQLRFDVDYPISRRLERKSKMILRLFANRVQRDWELEVSFVDKEAEGRYFVQLG